MGNGTANATAPTAEGTDPWLQLTVIAAFVALALLAGWVSRRGGRNTTHAMSPLGHVDELRRRLLVAVAAWLLASMVAFSFRASANMPFLLPSLQDNLAAQAFQQVAAHLVPDGVTLVVTRPLDGFVAQFTLALGIGFAAALPVIAAQVQSFFAPALQDRERRTVRRVLLPAALLFLAGAWFAWRFLLPFILDTLYGYSSALGAAPLLQVSDLVSFTVLFLLVFGLAFQLPLVMYTLARIGAVTSRQFLSKWRHATITILLLSAFVTDPSAFSQLMVAGPLLGLYFLGIGAARIAQPPS